jgi:hypothetical protein
LSGLALRLLEAALLGRADELQNCGASNALEWSHRLCRPVEHIWPAWNSKIAIPETPPPHFDLAQGECRFHSFELIGLDGNRTARFRFGEPFVVKIVVDAQEDIGEVLSGFSFITNMNREIMGVLPTTEAAALSSNEAEMNSNARLTP